MLYGWMRARARPLLHLTSQWVIDGMDSRVLDWIRPRRSFHTLRVDLTFEYSNGEKD